MYRHNQGGRGNASQARMNRRDEIVKQEQLLLEKKREIEERMRAQAAPPATADPVTAEALITLPIEPPTTKEASGKDDEDSVEIVDMEEETDETTDQPNNIFANDGSFMERFRKLQEEMAAKAKVEVSEQVGEEKEPPLEQEVNKPTIKVSAPQAGGLGARLKISDIEPATVKLEEDTDGKEESIRLAIERVAIAVAMNGETSLNSMRDELKDDPNYFWLQESNGIHYEYYQRRLAELRTAKSRADSEPDQPSASAPKKPRKSRWGEAPAPAAPVANIASQDQGLLQYARQVFGRTDLDDSQWKQLEDQRKMRVLVDMLKSRQAHNERLAKAGKVKYEYDSDEDVEGGTWEHKRRKEEMEKTKDLAGTLTERASGGHHIGDFLPPDELERFLQKWEAIKDGNASELMESDFQKFKLKEDNKGFKMLTQMGWGGGGLGRNETGIETPINMNGAGPANAGLGTAKPVELAVGDDEYDAYRKRMQVAYRFRPNPLNNPRRTYY